jgi:hypothetical protein
MRFWCRSRSSRSCCSFFIMASKPCVTGYRGWCRVSAQSSNKKTSSLPLVLNQPRATFVFFLHAGGHSMAPASDRSMHATLPCCRSVLLRASTARNAPRYPAVMWLTTRARERTLPRSLRGSKLDPPPPLGCSWRDAAVWRHTATFSETPATRNAEGNVPAPEIYLASFCRCSHFSFYFEVLAHRIASPQLK